MTINNAILFEYKEQEFAISVDNYSKENVNKALSALLLIDEEHIQQLSASMNYGLYGIKSTATSKELLNSGVTHIDGLSTKETPIVFKVKYIKILD